MTADNNGLPEEWTLATVEELAEPKGIAYGVLKPGPIVEDGVPMLRVSDIRHGGIDQSSIYRISETLDREYRRTKLKGGEVVLSIQGTVGRVAIVPAELAGSNVSRTLAMIRLRDPGLAKWVHRALESPQTQQAMRAVVGGTTRDSLNLRDLRRIEIPVAPEPERSEIIGQVEELLNLAEGVQRRLAAAVGAAERSSAAILAKAFRGGLASSRGQPTAR